MTRGTFEFDVDAEGGLLNTAGNVDALRRLWLDRELVQGYYLGPGDKGDFDNGAWHVACHLAGAGGVMRSRGGALVWLEISHDPARDEYFASATTRADGRIVTSRLDAAEGRECVKGAKLVGFVEGNSSGRISARSPLDSETVFNGWRRQDFDQPPGSESDGGKVWEHWCTLRDIRATARIGSTVLMAYVSLAAVLGDRFAATVARGRRDYGHPDQLSALVAAGFTSREAALWKVKPQPIPAPYEKPLCESTPAQSLEAIEKLNWGTDPGYYMFKRKIDSWSDAADVEGDLGPE